MEIKKFIKKLEKELNYLKTIYTIELDYIPLTKSDREHYLSEYDNQFKDVIEVINKFKKEHNI